MILLCDKKIRPIGVGDKPFFGWRITEEDGSIQKSYSIRVFDKDNNIFWETGRIESRKTDYVYYEGKELSSHKKYFWQVCVTTDKGTYTSERDFFVTAVIGEWKAKWITAKTKTAPIFKKEFYFKKKAEAYVSVCGLGYFTLKINSKKVGDDYFAPCRTDYDVVTRKKLQYPYDGETEKSLYFLTYDVTDWLKDGQNTVEIMLGNGMYRDTGRVTEGIFEYDVLKTVFWLTSGDFELISDEEWLVSESSLVKNSIFIGEIHDARLSGEIIGNAQTARPPKSEFLPQFAPCDKVRKIIKPAKISDTVYDCKECMTGLVKFRLSGKSGDVVRVRYAEALDENGKLDFSSTVGYIDCDKNQIQEDCFILGGDGAEEFMPQFVWHAFRYFQTDAPDVEIIDVQALYIYTAIKDNAYFECSNDLLNKIHNMNLNTQRCNIHGAIPMDCPHRERLGYTGDGQNTSYSLMCNFDAYDLYKKWIKDIMDAQNKETGYVPHTVPFNGGGGGIGWGSAIVFIPWNFYLHYGDKKSLEETLPSMKKWICYILNRLDERGLANKEEDGGWCLGDWILPTEGTWDRPQTLYLPNELVNTCFLIRCIDTYNKALSASGYKNDAFSKEREAAVNAVNNAYLKDYYAYGIQGCDVFPMHCKIVPREKYTKLLDRIISNLEKNNYKVDTGMYGTKILFELLTENNRQDVVYKILTQTNYPSYGNMIKNGATTVWETWEGNGALNHIGLTMIDFWFITGLCGIIPKDCGGFSEFLIKPYFHEDLEYLKASYTTIYGDIRVFWERNDKFIDLSVEIPFNTRALLFINNEKTELTRGKFRFVVDKRTNQHFLR